MVLLHDLDVSVDESLFACCYDRQVILTKTARLHRSNVVRSFYARYCSRSLVPRFCRVAEAPLLLRRRSYSDVDIHHELTRSAFDERYSTLKRYSRAFPACYVLLLRIYMAGKKSVQARTIAGGAMLIDIKLCGVL